jgi:hypothetical protein
MGDFVACKGDVRGCEESSPKEIAQRVVFFVECEKGGRGDTWEYGVS